MIHFKYVVLVVLSFLITSPLFAPKWEIIQYSDEGPVTLCFSMKAKKASEGRTVYHLTSLAEKDIPALVTIRRSEPVYTRYADHTCPTAEAATNGLRNFLSRVTSKNSLFPFVLKKGDDVLGLVNIGTGFNSEDRQFGYYLSPGKELNKEEAQALGRRTDLSEKNFENWGSGLGSKAIRVSGQFMMLFHTKARGALQILGKETLVAIGRTRFSGVLSATCDPENRRSMRPLQKLGLELVSSEAIAKLGYTEKVGKKLYWEMTWEKFLASIKERASVKLIAGSTSSTVDFSDSDDEKDSLKKETHERKDKTKAAEKDAAS